MVTGLNDTIRARKIRRLKLQRNIEIAEYHHIPWETPTDGDTDPEASSNGDNTSKRKKKRTKQKATRQSPAQKRKSAEACSYLARNTQPTIDHPISDVIETVAVGSRPNSPLVSINRAGASAANEDPPAASGSGGSGGSSLDNALRTIAADGPTVTLANSLLIQEGHSNAMSVVSEDLITAGSDTRQQAPKRKYNKLNDLNVVAATVSLILC